MRWEQIDEKLRASGEGLSKLIRALIGIALLLGVPLAGVVGSIYAGSFLASLAPAGFLAVVLFFGGAFVVLLFLSMYVWSPHIYPAVMRAVEALEPPQ